MRPQFERKGLTFTYRFEEACNVTPYLDHMRVTQVLLNVLGNAFKYTDSVPTPHHLPPPHINH